MFLSNISDISYIEGRYRNNLLCGQGKITHLNGDVLYCVFKAGYVTGPTKLYDKDCTLKQVCWFYRNVACGLVWKFLKGGGFLVGQVDSMGSMSGDNIAFLYPDLRTALYGTFIKGRMSVAQTCFVKCVTIRRQGRDILQFLSKFRNRPFKLSIDFYNLRIQICLKFKM